jgi:hypothetical protein
MFSGEETINYMNTTTNEEEGKSNDFYSKYTCIQTLG